MAEEEVGAAVPAQHRQGWGQVSIASPFSNSLPSLFGVGHRLCALIAALTCATVPQIHRYFLRRLVQPHSSVLHPLARVPGRVPVLVSRPFRGAD